MIVKTHYSVAWGRYTETKSYLTSVKEMTNHGMKQPYIDNILRLAFNAGYVAADNN